MRNTPFLVIAAVFSFLEPAAAQQAPVVTEAPLRAHLSLLADDLFEGRGTAQRGGDLAIDRVTLLGPVQH